jgi:ubiquinone/menaquinone biosynthesis C-methylase UbiE
MLNNKPQNILKQNLMRDPTAYARLYKGDSFLAYAFNTRLRIILNLIRERKEGKVLDVGCGPCIMASHLTEENMKLFEMDISEGMIRECVKSLVWPNITVFLRGRAEDLPFMDGVFDLVLGMGVLEYVTECGGALREFARVTKTGGTVIITMLNRICPYSLWERTVYRWVQLLRGKKTGKHTLIIRSERAFRRSIESSGLEILDVVYYGFYFFLSPLDRYMPQKAVQVSRRLEPFCRDHLKWLGTGFIVKARKK